MKGRIAVILSCAQCPYQIDNLCTYMQKPSNISSRRPVNVSKHIQDKTVPELCPLPMGDDMYKTRYQFTDIPSELLEWQPNDELMKFAKMFSERWTTIKDGLYRTQNQQYSVCIEQNEEPVSRIHVASKTVYFNRKRMVQSPIGDKDFVFFLFLWNFAYVQFNSIDRADIAVANYCIKQSLSEAKLLRGIIRLFKDDPQPVNRGRYENIKMILGKDSMISEQE